MSLKGIIRASADKLAAFPGVLPFFERRMRKGLTVLTYHRVLPDQMCADFPLKQLAMPESVFREEVRWLADRCRVLPLGDALTQLAACGGSAPPIVSLTFDDGHYDSHDVAAPILAEAGVHGTFFVAVDAVRTQGLLWFDRAVLLWLEVPCELLVNAVQEVLARPRPEANRMSTVAQWLRLLKGIETESRSRILADLGDYQLPENSTARFRCMTVEEVIALHRQGHEIGSHTLTHPILPRLSDAELLRELRQSRDEVGTWLGANVCGLCYPNGDYDARVVRVARSSGYHYSCTSSSGFNNSTADPMRLRRVEIRPDRVTTAGGLHSELRFRTEICLAYGPARRVLERLMSALRRST
jgi:peptidoglycan/xylan/chitin deacetylase (PgdA/CDA1 family)